MHLWEIHSFNRPVNKKPVFLLFKQKINEWFAIKYDSGNLIAVTETPTEKYKFDKIKCMQEIEEKTQHLHKKWFIINKKNTKRNEIRWFQLCWWQF